MKLFLPAAVLLTLLLSGCGDDKPYSGPNPSSDRPPSAPPPSVAEGQASSPSGQTSDPLIPGGSPVATADPLLPHDSQTGRDPLVQGDPLQGRTMPTDHSHWLRGQVRGAKLTVMVNGVRQGEYSGTVDQDITMRLRRGINSVSFVYAPRHPDSSAQMQLVESEHDPPIAPLVTFRSVPAERDATDLKPTTQSYSFIAR